MNHFLRNLLVGSGGLVLVSVATSAMACGGGGGFRIYRPNYSCNYSQPTVVVREAPPQPQVIIQQVPQQPAPQQFAQPQFQQQQMQQPMQNSMPNNMNGQMPMNGPTPNTGNQFQGQPNQGDAQQTALLALSGWDGSEVATAASQISSPAGNYMATLANGATIRLTLGTDGAFRWTANKDGKTTVGQGNYTLNGGALKLVRTGDQQKLEGGFIPTQQGFMLRVAGGKETNMNFVRV